MATPSSTAALSSVEQWRAEILRRVAGGERFAGMYGTGGRDECELSALLAAADGVQRLPVVVAAGADGVLSYAALSTEIEAAFWYERALHDLSGVVPLNHPRLEPLLLPRGSGVAPPRPGDVEVMEPLPSHEEHGPADVSGRGIFTIPFGPVRSGVFESIEFLVETPGEDVPHLNVRPHFKHRGVAKRFETLDVRDGVLVAERVEGIASVAHALAFSHAVEVLSSVDVPPAARLVRVIFAELERLANHLDVAMRLADAAGLAVATARFSWHKELVMRLTSRLCGNRFGRGVVVPGGVRTGLAVDPDVLTADVTALSRRLAADVRAVMNTASFLDRLRGTGHLDAGLAARFGALGPIGRACGYDDDPRRVRPYDGYRDLPAPTPPEVDSCDAVGRLRVRWTEVETSVGLILGAARALDGLADDRPGVVVEPGTGYATGWAEAPQGEVLYGLELADGRIRRCFARSASFHNLALFHDVWRGDVLTDFAFIEASFGLSYAAVAM
jgi:Ni,Fe-hydrogenase III large subunit